MKRYVIQLHGIEEFQDENYFINMIPSLMHIWIARDNKTNEFKGYGFIEFYNNEDLLKAIDYINDNIKNVIINVIL